MKQQEYLYWSFQSVHNKELEIGSKEDISFRAKYKKDYQTRELYNDTEVVEKFNMNAWRNPNYSRITSLILAKEYNGELIVDYIEGNEKDLLQTFYNKLKNKHADCQLVHFDAGIVLPYIGTRFRKNGFKSQVHPNLKYMGLKSWELSGVCLKNYYKGGGDYTFSLEDIADIEGIECDFIHYDSEYTYYHSNQFQALKDSAINKVVTIAKVHRELFELPQLEWKLLEDFVKDVEPEKPLNWLDELYKEQQFTLEIIDGLKQQVLGSKKKPTKKDLEVVFETIRGAYVITDFETRFQDSKDTIEIKEKEIKSIIELWK
jgi:hypothetical protein